MVRIFFPTEVQPGSGYFQGKWCGMPSGLCMGPIPCCLMQVGHFFTTSLSCLLRPGHHTEVLALSAFNDALVDFLDCIKDI